MAVLLRLVSVGLLASVAWAGGAQAPSVQEKPERPQSKVPYVPTPPDVVDRMLRLADVGPSDIVYDLGCGDGRIVIAAAKNFGASGVGIDIDPQRIKEARAGAEKAGVTDRVEFRQQDILDVDVSGASVVTLYLLSDWNRALRPTLQQQLKPGARVVSHAFDMGDWMPDDQESFTDESGITRNLYLWRIKGETGGR